MKNVFQKGFNAFKEEEERRELIRQQKKGKLFRFFLTEDEEDVPVVFLTEEPILFYEHIVKDGGNYLNIPCSQDESCKYCQKGDKPSYKGAFLVIDRREFEVDEKDENGNKTGKTKTIKDRAKIFVRGTKDLGTLYKLSKKYGLVGREWYITRTGSGTSSQLIFDRGDSHGLTNEEIQNMLPDNLRGKDYYEIVTEQLFGESDDNKEQLRSSISNAVEEDDEEEIPRKSLSLKRR